VLGVGVGGVIGRTARGIIGCGTQWSSPEEAALFALTVLLFLL
jgi:hypothetical protein